MLRGLLNRRVLIPALVLIVLAGVALVIVRPAWPGRAPTDAERCEGFRANAEAAPDTMPGPGATVGIVGDSWTSGYQLDDPSDSWAYRLAESQQWNATVDGFAGSGYVNPSACGDQRFADRLAALPPVDMVIVEGGLNDVDSADRLAELPQAASAALTAAPGEQLVVIGVPESPARDAALIAEANRDLRAAAESAGARFVDPTGWRLEYVPDDPLHLTEYGHQQFAHLVGEELAAATG